MGDKHKLSANIKKRTWDLLELSKQGGKAQSVGGVIDALVEEHLESKLGPILDQLKDACKSTEKDQS